METYSFLQKPIAYNMYFWLDYCDENHIALKDIDYLFCLPVKKLRLIIFICFCFLMALKFMILNTSGTWKMVQN